MKRTILLFSSLIVMLALFVLPATPATAQSHMPRSGPFCQGTGCDAKFENGGVQNCNVLYSTAQTDGVYDTHGNYVGILSLFVSPSAWCSSSWGGLRDDEPGIAVSLYGGVGNYNTEDQSGYMQGRAISHGQWSSTTMDEYSGERCISVWISGIDGYGYSFSHKLISGGSGC